MGGDLIGMYIEVLSFRQVAEVEVCIFIKLQQFDFEGMQMAVAWGSKTSYTSEQRCNNGAWR